MAIETGDLARLRARAQQANDKRVAAESRLEHANAEEARLLAEVREQYGIDTLAGLEALLTTEEAALADEAASLEAALSQAEANAAALS